MGITELCVSFSWDRGSLEYTNAQGKKSLLFGFDYNEISEFPEDGYSDRIGGVPGKKHYRCASSAAWIEPNTLLVKVQIIDQYLGNLHIKLHFSGDRIAVQMQKKAEGFLSEYEGFAEGILVD